MNGKWHGQGTYSYPDGRKVVGEFIGRKDWNTKEYDIDGNIIRKWVNGKGAVMKHLLIILSLFLLL